MNATRVMLERPCVTYLTSTSPQVYKSEVQGKNKKIYVTPSVKSGVERRKRRS